MNKHFRITSLIIIVTFLSSQVQARGADSTTNPIYVKPMDLAIARAQNKKDEMSVQLLIEESKRLVYTIEKTKSRLNTIDDGNSDFGKYVQLRQMLNTYQEQIDARDRLLAAQQNQLMQFKSRLSLAGGVLDQIVDASHDVGYDNQKYRALNDALAQKNEMLTLQLAELRSKDQELRSLKDELYTLNDQLQRAKDGYDRIIKEYQQKLSNALSRQDVENLQERYSLEISTITSTVRTQTAKLENLTQDLRIKDQRIMDLESELLNKDQEILRLKSELAQARAEINQLQEQLAQDGEALKVIHAKTADYSARFSELTQNTLSKENEIRLLKEKLDAARNQNIDQETIKVEMEMVKKQMTSSAQEVSLLKTQLDKSNDALEDLARKSSDYQNEIQRLQLESSRKESDIASLKDQLRDAKSVGVEADSLKLQMDVMKNQGKLSQDEVARLKDQLSKDDEALKEIHAKTADFKSKFAQLQSEANAKQAEIDRLNQRLRDAEAKAAEVEALRLQLDVMKQQSAAKTKEVAELQVKLDEGKANLDSLNGQMDQLKNQVELLKADLLRKENENLELKAKLDEAKNNAADPKELKDLKDKLSESNESLLGLQNQMADMKSKYASLEEASNSKEDQVNALREQLKQAEAKASTPADNAEMERLRQELVKDDKALQDIHAKTAEFKKKYQSLADAAAQKDAQIKKLQEELSSMPKGQEDPSLKEKAARMNDEMGALRNQLSNASDALSKVEQLEAQLKKAQNEAEELKKQIAQDDAAFTKLREQGLKLKEQLKSQKDEIVRLKSSAGGSKEGGTYIVAPENPAANDALIATYKQQLADAYKELEKYRGETKNPVAQGGNGSDERYSTEYTRKEILGEEVIVSPPTYVLPIEVVGPNGKALSSDIVTIKKYQQLLSSQEKTIQDYKTKLATMGEKSTVVEKTVVTQQPAIQEINENMQQDDVEEVLRNYQQLIKLKDEIIKGYKDKLHQQQTKPTPEVQRKQSSVKEVVKEEFKEKASAETPNVEHIEKYVQKELLGEEIIDAPPIYVLPMEVSLVNSAMKIKKHKKLLTSKIAAIEAKKDQLKTAFALLEKQRKALYVLKQGFEQLTQSIAQVYDRIDAMQAKYDAKANELDAKIDVVLGEKTADLATAKERLRLQEELDARRQAHMKLLDERNELIAKRAESLQRDREALQQDRESYIQKVSGMQVSVDQLNEQIKALNAKLAAKDKEKQDLYHMIDQFKVRLKETSDINNFQESKMNALNDQIERMNADVQQSKDQVEAKKLSIQKLEGDIKQMSVQFKDVQQSAAAKDLSLSMVQSSLEEKEKSYQAKVTLLQDQMKKADASIVGLQERLNVAEAKLQQALKNDELDRISEMLKASREEVIQLNHQLKIKEALIANLQKELSSNGIEFTRQNRALESIQADVQKKQADVKQLTEIIADKNSEINRLKEQLKRNKLDLLPALGKKAADNVDDQIHFAAINAEIKKTNGDLKAASESNDVKRLKEALKDAREQITTLKIKLKQNIEGAMKHDPKFMQMEEELKTLRQTLDEIKDENSKIRSDNSDLFKELQQTRKSLADCSDSLGILKESPEDVSMPKISDVSTE